MLNIEKEIKKITNPKRWKLLGNTSNNQQLVIKLGHLNPEVSMNSINAERNKVIKQEKRGNTIETTSTFGIITKKGKMADFYESMIFAIQSGLITELTIKDIQDLRNRASAVSPEECDYLTSISVIDYKDEKIATQALENIASQYVKGIASAPIPGAPNGMSIEDAFKNPIILAEMQKQGRSAAEISMLLETFKQASSQLVNSAAKANVRYEIGKYNQYPAVYFSLPAKVNTISKEKKKDRFIEIKNSDGTITRIQASGGFDDRVQFPPNAFEKEKYPIGGKTLQAIQVGKYLISGGLLTSLNFAPSGKLFCQSLTEFKTITKVSHEGDMTYIDNLIVPLNSCLEKEGYMNREEIEDIIDKLISIL